MSFDTLTTTLADCTYNGDTIVVDISTLAKGFLNLCMLPGWSKFLKTSQLREKTG